MTFSKNALMLRACQAAQVTGLLTLMIYIWRVAPPLHLRAAQQLEVTLPVKLHGRAPALKPLPEV